ncbi:MAG: GNAT family N-acetyltransferase, partial [Acidobacteria bacterium]|nr:GNAT family N-acetyltransferase [Acidobacteriota bacterium]NIM60314.1 GNAT family N-acetyltransferase [Acidobacteriota bacterium]NIO58560.1 GNAT family N-acetyltransferase [Acidobacteriota bacterium]NIQ29609.1 GNAT family N-acetyltransferase [Acidobacteriota bacterium]NIQ84319.1 GNAT family N-acetyltransferase [Acidobacteriota bacterium]
FSLGMLDREQTRRKLDRVLDEMNRRNWDSFVVEQLEDDRFAGLCGLAAQEVDGADEIELGYRLMPEFWGRGLATEAARACRDYALRTLGLPRIISIIEPDNVGSIRVAEKAGLRYERDTRKWDRVVRIYALAAGRQSEMPSWSSRKA